MTQQAYPRFFGGHPATVIANSNQLSSRPRKLNFDAGRARVERILHQFLNDSRRTLDNLTRRNLVDRGGIEELDSGGRNGTYQSILKQD